MFSCWRIGINVEIIWMELNECGEGVCINEVEDVYKGVVIYYYY